MRTRSGIVIALVVVALPTSVIPAAKPSVKNRLEAVVKELRQTQKSLREVMRDERETTRLLSELDQGLIKARKEFAELDAVVKSLDGQVAKLRSKVQVDVESVTKLKQRLRGRLRALARFGSGGYMGALLSATTLHDLALRRALLARVAAYDAALLKALQEGKAELRSDQSELLQRHTELTASRGTAAAALEVMEQARVDRSEAVLALGAKRGALDLQLEALRSSQKKLQQKIWSQVAAQQEAVGLAVNKGKLPWPVTGRREKAFSPTAAKGSTSSATGWTLRAALGTKVRAISEGRVAHAGFLRGYGLLVILDHGHGYHTLHAHLSRSAVTVGNQVSRGDLLGYVGDSESLDGAKLYFELRRGGRPVNPANWLSSQPTSPSR